LTVGGARCAAAAPSSPVRTRRNRGPATECHPPVSRTGDAVLRDPCYRGSPEEPRRITTSRRLRLAPGTTTAGLEAGERFSRLLRRHIRGRSDRDRPGGRTSSPASRGEAGLIDRDREGRALLAGSSKSAGCASYLQRRPGERAGRHWSGGSTRSRCALDRAPAGGVRKGSWTAQRGGGAGGGPRLLDAEPRRLAVRVLRGTWAHPDAPRHLQLLPAPGCAAASKPLGMEHLLTITDDTNRPGVLSPRMGLRGPDPTRALRAHLLTNASQPPTGVRPHKLLRRSKGEAGRLDLHSFFRRTPAESELDGAGCGVVNLVAGREPAGSLRASSINMAHSAGAEHALLLFKGFEADRAALEPLPLASGGGRPRQSVRSATTAAI